MDLNGTFHTLLVINGYQIKQFSATPLKLTTDTVINTTCLMITITTNPSYNNQIAKMLFYAIIYNQNDINLPSAIFVDVKGSTMTITTDNKIESDKNIFAGMRSFFI